MYKAHRRKKKQSPRGRQTEKYPVISDHHVGNNKQALPASSCPKARQRDKWREYHKLLCEGKSCFLPWMLKRDMLLTARKNKKKYKSTQVSFHYFTHLSSIIAPRGMKKKESPRMNCNMLQNEPEEHCLPARWLKCFPSPKPWGWEERKKKVVFMFFQGNATSDDSNFSFLVHLQLCCDALCALVLVPCGDRY